MARKKSLNFQEERDAYILVAPLMLLLLIFILFPVLSNFYYSLTQWKGFGTPQLVGLDNYRRMFSDDKF